MLPCSSCFAPPVSQPFALNFTVNLAAAIKKGGKRRRGQNDKEAGEYEARYILGLASPPSNLPTNSCMGVYAFLS
jgi:hypothetical protein